MAIYPVNSGNVANTVSQTKSTARTEVDTKSPAPVSVSGDDTVSLTDGIANPSDVGTSAPMVNDNRVANIKAALQSGSYQIDPERIAEKLMQLDLNLPNTT